MGVTIRGIAKHVGVHETVVSKVLNRAGSTVRVSEVTREKVLATAQKLGYRVNSSAQSMRKGRTSAAALLLPTNPLFGYLPDFFIPSAADLLSAQNMHLTVARLPDQKLMDAGFVPKILRELAVDALLINYIAAVPQRIVDLIHEFKIPSIWLNSKQETDCAYPDDVAAGRDATDRLLALGHRRIEFLSFGEAKHYSESDRLSGYREAMIAAGLPPRSTCQPVAPYPVRLTTRGDDRVKIIHQMLSRPDRPTAIVAYESGEALPVIQAATELGLRVPQDLSLITFHSYMVDGSGISVSTMVHLAEKLAEASISMLVRKMKKREVPLPSRAVPGVWFEGDTCGPVPVQ